jgi:hypothetical protein
MPVVEFRGAHKRNFHRSRFTSSSPSSCENVNASCERAQKVGGPISLVDWRPEAHYYNHIFIKYATKKERKDGIHQNS